MNGLNYFIYNGIDSRTMGVYVGCLDELVFPQLRGDLIEIPGRDGFILDSDGSYGSYSREIECVFEENANIPRIAKWLQGMGELILSTDLTKKYEVRIQNNISLTSVAIYYRNFILNLEFQPWAESVQEYIIQVDSDSMEFDIGGTLEVRPTIEVTGTGDITLMINDKELHLYDLPESTTIIIDCKYQIMKIGTQNASNYVGGAMLSEIKLQPTDNEVSITGDYEDIKFKYRRTDLC